MRCIFSCCRRNLTSSVLFLSVMVVIYIVFMSQTQSRPKALLIETVFMNRLNQPPDKIFNFNISIDKIIHRTHKRYLSFSIDSSQIKSGLHKPSLRSLSLIAKMSHLEGGYLRVGGTAADLLVFSLAYRSPTEHQLPPDGGYCSYTQTECRPINLKKFAMSADNWNDINHFSKQTGLKLLFDLNVLLRGIYGWNSTNAEFLMDFSFAYQYNIDWQLGNEPNSFPYVFQKYVSPAELASDFSALKRLISKYTLYNSSTIVGPDVTNPRGLNLNPVTYLDEFLSSKPEIDAVSWHHYNTGSNATIQDFLNVDNFNDFITSSNIIYETVQKSASNKQIWLTETGSSYGGGAEGLSDKFISTFFWIDKLGASAKNNISVVVRQSIYHGHYSLLNEETLKPNPDYWVSILFKKLVGNQVLNIQCTDEDCDDTLRIYAHCAKGHNKPILFGTNISNYSQALNLGLNSTASLYSLTSPSLLSSTVLLNGKILALDYFDNIPILTPIDIKLDIKTPVTILPYSIFFLIVDIIIPVCYMS